MLLPETRIFIGIHSVKSSTGEKEEFKEKGKIIEWSSPNWKHGIAVFDENLEAVEIRVA
jgi:hypothetical protein